MVPWQAAKRGRIPPPILHSSLPESAVGCGRAPAFARGVNAMYKTQRNYENLQRAMFPGVGEYGIPALEPVRECEVENWIGFNYAKGCEEPEQRGVHFFVDDYQFQRVWTNPDAYLPMLRRFQAVCTPDFSLYTDFPKAVQIYNHWRKHWLGAYLQQNGVKVIPTVGWSDESSFAWCFDGEPVGSTVAVSSVGTQANPESRRLFLEGWREMLHRLRPAAVIFYGRVPEGCDDVELIRVTAFQDVMRKRIISGVGAKMG